MEAIICEGVRGRIKNEESVLFEQIKTHPFQQPKVQVEEPSGVEPNLLVFQLAREPHNFLVQLQVLGMSLDPVQVVGDCP